MRRLIVLLAILLAPAALSAGDGSPYRWPLPDWMPPPPVPADNPMSDAKVELGRHLFHDTRLSGDGTLSCISCHVQERAFTDARPVAIGINGTVGVRNSPSLANVGYFPQLTWGNPHMERLEFQVLLPIFGDNPDEMGANGKETQIFAKLAADPYYVKAFPAVFPEHPQIDLFTITRALGAFERTILSVNSAYDRYKYANDKTAMSDAALRGEQLFFDHRFECYHCHSGVHLTDNLQTERSAFRETGMHNNGLYNIDGKGAYPPQGTGLIEFTGEADDMGKFRTPSLRNVALTAPYFHDGSAATLRDVLAHYAAGGRTIKNGPYAGDGSKNPHKDGMIVGFNATESEIDDLIAFLESLTDETFLKNPAYSDPWPQTRRTMSAPVEN